MATFESKFIKTIYHNDIEPFKMFYIEVRIKSLKLLTSKCTVCRSKKSDVFRTLQ